MNWIEYLTEMGKDVVVVTDEKSYEIKPNLKINKAQNPSNTKALSLPLPPPYQASE
tara:strand:+ start:21502 stop:21669 length:168 start_codon:yes stop_codon:yes gene_type:complete